MFCVGVAADFGLRLTWLVSYVFLKLDTENLFFIDVADELLVHYRGGVGKSNEKGGGGTLEAGRGDLKGDAFFKLKSGIHFTFMAALRCACTAERGACWL